MLPTFLVIGAMKSASSTLCELLGAHPQVFMTSPKEPEFFCHEERYSKGLGEYERLFASAGDKRARGEGSTSYSKRAEFPGTAGRIAATVPDAKLIYLVRHPLDRIESQWGYHQRYEGFGASITREALQRDERLIDPSRYHAQLQEFRQYYDASRMLVLFHEDLERDPANVMRQAFAFLDVDPAFQVPGANRRQHVSTFRTDRALLIWLKSSERFQRLQRAIPVAWKGPARALLQRDTGRPRWEPSAREFAINALRADTEAFLREQDKPPEHWPLR